MCHGAHSDVNDWTMEYGEPRSFEEQQNKSKVMDLKNSNDIKQT
jgi:hypothetical protein